MFDDDEEEPKDWEIEDENPPEKLRRKWIEEDLSPQETVDCPACKKTLPRESLTCLFCGAQVYQDSGLLGKFLKWIKTVLFIPKR